MWNCILAYSAYFKIKKEKESIISVRVGLKKSVPLDHSLSSLLPSDDKLWSRGTALWCEKVILGMYFLSYPHTHDRFL